METPIETPAAPATRARSATPLTRVLELLAERSGQALEPRQAWEAAAEGLAGGRGEATQSLALAARRVGLRVGPSTLSWPCASAALADLQGPLLTWLPERGGAAEGGRWLLLLGRRRARIRAALIDEAGERQLELRPAAMIRWLDRERDGHELRWWQSEAILPLSSIGASALRAAGARRLGPLRRLAAVVQLEREDLAVVAVYAVAIGSMSLAVPVAVQALVNSVAFGSVLQPLIVLSVLLAAVLSFVAVLRVLQALVVEMLQRRLFVRAAADFARRLPRLSAEARRRYHGPELANRLFDVVTLQKTGASLLIDGLALVLQMAAGMVLLAFYHPILLAFDLALLLAVALIVTVLGRGALSTSLVESKRKYAVAAWIEDLAGNPLAFAGGPARTFADDRTELLIREWLRARGDHFSRVFRQLCSGIGLQVIASTALLALGGALVMQREMTLGQLVAAELVVTMIGVGLGKLAKQLEGLYDATTSAAKLAKVVDLELERDGGELLGGDGPLAVRIGASEDEERVVVELEHGASEDEERVVELEPGAKLGLRGRSFAHAALLDGLFGSDPDALTKLDLRLDGRALRALELESLRAQIALVRGAGLVAGSVLDNLDPRPLPSTTQDVREVLERVDLLDRLIALPEGLQTQLTSTGAPLCESEARRLVLARALLARPRLLLIDGGLDGLGLDAPARDRLLDHLFADDSPWTLVVSSEDPQLLARCGSQLRLP